MNLSTLHEAVADIAPFSFQNLPGEIRNKVYKILLCGFDDPIGWPPHDRPTLSLLPNDMHTQILRTCRKIYQEGSFLMRNTNLFILFNIEVGIESPEITEPLEYVPFLVKDQSHVEHFRGVVMTHDLIYNRTTREQNFTAPPTMSFILLHRHLHHLCKALSYMRWAIGAHDDVVLHMVTFPDLYRSENHDEIHTSFTRKIQEQLVAPYRSGMKGFPNFALKGAIEEDLKIAAISDITLMPEFYKPSQLTIFINDKRNLTRLGVCHFHKNELDDACMLWKRCISKINADFASETGDRLRKSGGVDLMNKLTSLYTTIASKFAQATLIKMGIRMIGQPEQLLLAADAVADMAEGRTRWLTRFSDQFTWQPTAFQLVKWNYREAVCARFSNDSRYLLVGQEKIDLADRLMPGTPRVLAEKLKIEVAIREFEMMSLSTS
ncbi:hypothetical protein EYC80_010293 [Monilinia laxa]|uniref:F-box domain-containing protein n=1 Tax=Monilinia laxa TaxID=61186 RepID=A0A5N6JNB0_MONLA|nr:hypothetical protein EYC80_010293 [Monilinia laxa]